MSSLYFPYQIWRGFVKFTNVQDTQWWLLFSSRSISTIKLVTTSCILDLTKQKVIHKLNTQTADIIVTTASSRRGTANLKSRHPLDKIRTMSSQEDLQSDSGLKTFSQRFLDCAARGDLDKLKNLISSVDIDVKSERGWTALMFAARNGHTSIISTLIEKGCDVSSLNASGQTARDIAEFWNHKEATSLLSQHKQDEQFEQFHNYYSLNPLYRASDIRKDDEALQVAKRNPSSKYILFSNLQPFLLPTEGPKIKYKFALFSGDQLPSHALEKSRVVFLGLETWDPESNAWFAVDLGNEGPDVAKNVYPSGNFVTPFPATMQMDSTHAGIFAEAHSILCWLDRYKFCPTCGSDQTVVNGGYKQICSKLDCTSHKGVHNTCYPRVDPSLIMLVMSTDKHSCLLGRQKRFPPKMYSCLAGFMEPGECIEDTCRREVEEESGVKVGKVEYHSSQPWPFPASLMLGCIAHARNDNIKMDKDELEDARWFTRSETAQMLAQQHPGGLFVPPKQTIAHQLIKAWLSSTHSNL
uniref:NAD-capped RNA hydrolase NUDT12 n=1 Tax=Arion vulgaris TaxID=1028688 RepID=A0A0B7A769_9EUPU